MIITIRSERDADYTRALLEDELNALHNHAAKSWASHKIKEHSEASKSTQCVHDSLRRIELLEAELCKWEAISEEERDEARSIWLDEHEPDECDDDPDCTRDHGAEMADSAAETRWEIERDNAV